jgi:urease accessory protein UreF
VVEEGPRPSGGAQREAALLIVEAWTALARDLMVAAAGRPEIAATATLDPELQAIAMRIGQAALRDFIALLERIRDGLRQNAAPRLALEVAMLAWPSHAGR